MTAERKRGISRGGKVAGVNTVTDEVRIQRPDGTVITVGPAVPKRAERRATVRVEKPISKVEGAKFSLFPLMEKALADSFRSLLPPEPGFFEGLRAQSPFTYEGAVNTLRKHEYSVDRTTEEVIEDFLVLSRTQGDVNESARAKIATLLRPLVHELYIETTEVKPGKK